jgi:hypothetical protein
MTRLSCGLAATTNTAQCFHVLVREGFMLILLICVCVCPRRVVAAHHAEARSDVSKGVPCARRLAIHAADNRHYRAVSCWAVRWGYPGAFRSYQGSPYSGAELRAASHWSTGADHACVIRAGCGVDPRRSERDAGSVPDLRASERREPIYCCVLVPLCRRAGTHRLSVRSSGQILNTLHSVLAVRTC